MTESPRDERGPGEGREPEAQPRRGLVLGGGGVLGAAWLAGALTAYEDVVGADARDAEMLVGTSAGSILAALLAAGVSVAQLRQHELEGTLDSGLLAGFSWDYDSDTGGSRPQAPRLGLGSPALLRKGVAELRTLPTMTVLAALMPVGRGRLDFVGALVAHVVPQGWVHRPGLRVVALDYDAGERVAFGAPDAPDLDLADAVMASCSIPGWYQPVEVDGHRYIDGGAWSSTNADLLLGLGLDEIYVLAPQISLAPDSPSEMATRIERQWRQRVTERTMAEVTALAADGADVVAIGPGREDLEAMGGNLMDVTRRHHVLHTSLRTSQAALRDPHHEQG